MKKDEEQKAVISMVLSAEETERLKKAKDISGLKNNAEIFRHLLTLYTGDFVPPKMRG